MAERGREKTGHDLTDPRVVAAGGNGDSCERGGDLLTKIEGGAGRQGPGHTRG